MCSAEHPEIIDEIITDITCCNLPKIQNDVTACYDRMVTNLNTLYSRLRHVPDESYKL